MKIIIEADPKEITALVAELAQTKKEDEHLQHGAHPTANTAD